jgi:hypothetical protein
LSYTLIFRKQFYFVVSGLKMIGHGNSDNNFESPCIKVESGLKLGKEYVFLVFCSYEKGKANHKWKA